MPLPDTSATTTDMKSAPTNTSKKSPPTSFGNRKLCVVDQGRGIGRNRVQQVIVDLGEIAPAPAAVEVQHPEQLAFSPRRVSSQAPQRDADHQPDVVRHDAHGLLNSV